jgi:hypothetical protein
MAVIGFGVVKRKRCWRFQVTLTMHRWRRVCHEEEGGAGVERSGRGAVGGKKMGSECMSV